MKAMDIFFAADDIYTQHLGVGIASILVNSKPDETFNFHILMGTYLKKIRESLKN